LLLLHTIDRSTDLAGTFVYLRDDDDDGDGAMNKLLSINDHTAHTEQQQ
jgi:hypothetical protein